MRKDPTLACLLNLLLPGTGHVYIGRPGRGVLIFALVVVLGILTWGIGAILVVGWAMYDAHRIATTMQQPEKTAKSGGGGKPLGA